MIDPVGARFGTVRIVRGSGFLSFSAECRSAFRDRQPPDAARNEIGFRIMQTVVFKN